MKEVIIYGGITALAFLAFVIMLVFGLLRKNWGRVVGSMVLLCVAILVGTFTFFKILAKGYSRLGTSFERRTGIEIYRALFDEPNDSCVRVIHHQDQLLPKIDFAIWLHFKTCPEEMTRILAQRKYDVQRTSTKPWLFSGWKEGTVWFKPETMGDTILSFSDFDERANGQQIYCSLDSTEAYCIDVLD